MASFVDRLSPIVLVLNQEELEFLERWGEWLDRLEKEHTTSAPDDRPTNLTARQQHFLAVVQGHAEPSSWEERLWLRVRRARREAKRFEELAQSLQAQRGHADRIATLAGRMAKLEKMVDDLRWYQSVVEQHLAHRDDSENPTDVKADPPSPSFAACPRCGGVGDYCQACGGSGNAFSS